MLLDALLMTASLVAVLQVRRQPSWRRATLAGLVIGLCSLTRSTVLAFLPIAALWIIWTATDRRRATIAAALTVLVAIMVLAPWVIRNSLILGEIVGISSEKTEWFWRGNNAMVARGDRS